MKRTSIDDLLGSILSEWFQSVAEWTPPGRLSALTCTECSSSLLASCIDLDTWPHELMHQLAERVESVREQVTEFVVEQAQPGEEQRARDWVDFQICDQIRSLAGDITDVLFQCVEPRLDAYLSESIELAFLQADTGR